MRLRAAQAVLGYLLKLRELRDADQRLQTPRLPNRARSGGMDKQRQVAVLEHLRAAEASR